MSSNTTIDALHLESLLSTVEDCGCPSEEEYAQWHQDQLLQEAYERHLAEQDGDAPY